MKTAPKTTTRHFKHLPQSKAHELQPIKEKSDRRIRDAIKQLQKTLHGQAALKDLRTLCEGDARHLDMSNMSALVILVREFAYGRRDFLEQIKTKISCPCSDGGEHEEIMRAIGH